MPSIALDLRDFVWLVSLIVTVSLAYARLQSEIRHLDDTKASRHETMLLGEELRATLGEIRTSLARLEEAIRMSRTPPVPPENG